jgi:hypothetical protein
MIIYNFTIQAEHAEFQKASKLARVYQSGYAIPQSTIVRVSFGVPESELKELIN